MWLRQKSVERPLVTNLWQFLHTFLSTVCSPIVIFEEIVVITSFPV